MRSEISCTILIMIKAVSGAIKYLIILHVPCLRQWTTFTTHRIRLGFDIYRRDLPAHLKDAKRDLPPRKLFIHSPPFFTITFNAPEKREQFRMQTSPFCRSRPFCLTLPVANPNHRRRICFCYSNITISNRSEEEM